MLDNDHQALMARAGERDICILPAMGNRHGLITGATGTGKTVTLQSLAETFSALGVPVFLADVKGDLSGLAKAGAPTGKVAERIARLGLAARGYLNQAFPVCFWDVFGKSGHPLRATVSEMGPLLLSRLLNLNEVQSGVLHLVFRIADDAGLLLLDMKDLRSMVQHVGDERDQYRTAYGQISTASVGAIQRGLLRMEEEGGDRFFGEPALDIMDLLQTDSQGRGVVNILAADALMNAPRLYSSVLLWLLSELFERLPEVGDTDKPRLVFFFDEAHGEQKAVRAAARAFRPNPAFNTEDVIGQLAVGEALVSFLDADGAPRIVERALIVPPQSQVGPITPEERAVVMRNSLVAGAYERAVDRESAYEILTARAARRQEAADDEARRKAEALAEKERLRQEAAVRREETRARRSGGGDGLGDILGSVARQTTRTIGTTVGREIGRTVVRGLLGGLFGKR